MDKNKITPLIVYPVNNGYTNSYTPTIHGTGEPESTINLTLNQQNYTTKVGNNGIWNVNVNTVLVEGESYNVTVIQTSNDGTNAFSDPLSFIVDSKAQCQHQVTFPTSNQYINEKLPNVSGTGKAGATIEVVVNGKSYNSLVNQSGSWNIQLTDPLNEGLNFMNVIQKDMGNVSPAVTVNFTVATVAPQEPVITAPADMEYISTPQPVISGQAEPNATIDVVVDNIAYTAQASQVGNWSVEVSESLSDDAHVILAKQKDLAGNISPEATAVFTVDTTSPNQPRVIYPINGQFISCPSPSITGFGDAGNRIEINYNGKIYSSLVQIDGSFSVDITDSLCDGMHTFRVFQVDKAGNVSPSAELVVNLDTTIPPTPVILYPMNESIVNTPVFSIKGTGEPDATIEIKLAGKNYETKVDSNGSWTIQVNDTFTEEQQYSIIASQVDVAGNVGPSVRIKFKIDTNYLKAPKVTYPVGGTALNTEYPFITGTALSGATVNLSVNGCNYTSTSDDKGTWSLFLNKKLSQGLCNVFVNQTDNGNTSPTSNVSFYVDTIAPAAPVFVAPIQNSIVLEKKLVIRGTGEADASVDLELDNQKHTATVGSTGFFEITVNNIASGIHTIVATLRDRAGNISPSATLTFTVNNMDLSKYKSDGNPAIGTITFNPANEPYATTLVIATLTTNKPVKFDNIIGTVFSKIITCNGVTPFTFVDLEGNEGCVYAAVTWIDDTAPLIDIISNGNYFSADKVINYYKASSGAIQDATLNGVSFASGKTVTDEGEYQVVVTDRAGHKVCKGFVIDRTPPTVLGVSDNTKYNSDVNIRYYDSLSGIKSATLNNMPFASGVTLTDNGQYTLTVSDFGDNATEVNFTIMK